MESHDEERLMYENMKYGNVNGAYNTRELNTALERMEEAAAFFFTIPGPKMIWQFGELGYDFNINYNGRVGSKPIKWEYKNNPNRQHLLKTYQALIKLKTENPCFRTSDFDISAWGKQKQIHINDGSMNVTIFGNFDVADQNTYTGFQHTGKWYDYFTGNELDVTNTQMTIPLKPGKFHIYTNKKLPVPDMSIHVAPDVTAPEITLIGNNPDSTLIGTPYKDTDGAIANDDIDGKLDDKIIVTGTVDHTKAGTYTLEYNVSDAADNKAKPVKRKMKVYDPNANGVEEFWVSDFGFILIPPMENLWWR